MCCACMVVVTASIYASHLASFPDLHGAIKSWGVESGNKATSHLDLSLWGSVYHICCNTGKVDVLTLRVALLSGTLWKPSTL